MQSNVSRVVLFVVGLILLGLGLFKIGSAILPLFNSHAATIAIVIPTHWMLMAICGAVVCVASFFVGKKQD